MQPSASPASVSLDDLKSVHENLIAWMWALDDLTQEEEPKLGRLETVRWFLGKARRDRRLLVGSAYNALLPSLTGPAKAAMEATRSLTLESLSAGSEHISTWSREAIAVDWRGYCEATRKMRDTWLRAIEAEQRALYPQLRPSVVEAA